MQNESELQPNHFNKPNEEALYGILIKEDCSPIGTIIHLAWKCGLMRNEIPSLKWKQVDLDCKRIELEDRIIPFQEDTMRYLDKLYIENKYISDYVLVSQKKSAPMAEQSVSRIVRHALDAVGQTTIKLSDLRVDYITRLLEENDWEYVSYTAGVDEPTLRENYLPYVEKSNLRNFRKPDISNDIRNRLMEFVAEVKTDTCGMAIRFVWEFGLLATALPSLTWEILDIENCEIHYNNRVIQVSPETMKLLEKIKETNCNEDPHIFLTENTKKPMDYPYLQRIIIKGLVRSGIFGISLSALYVDYWKNKFREQNNSDPSENVVPRSISNKIFFEKLSEVLIDYLNRYRFADSITIERELRLSHDETNKIIKSCREKGEIEKIGNRYFLKGTVVPKEKQHEVILEYVLNNQPVTSKELVELLGLVERRQILPIIKPLLSSGKLIRKSVNRYCLGSSGS